jgi:tRNA A-37 threonylcarbamoyl transferase component Bud32
MIGETIGHFEIVARAGRGGMGDVYVAAHKTIRTRVAIKVMHAQISANTDHVQRFFNEARAVARIQHAGIVKMFDVGFHANDRAYLIMEYLEGETLATRLKRAGRLSPRSTMEIARQIASVLDATHHAGIIHRDLKPENMFVVQDRELASGERVKILDFGIAKLSDTLTGPTTVGTIGTPTYMAPEQWSDSSTVDWRADVYSLGCIVYEMAGGRPPFLSRSIAEACAKHLNDAPTALGVIAPDVPRAIDELALRLLAKRPSERAASLAALERELAELAAAMPADEPPRDRGRLAARPSSRTTLSGAIATTASSAALARRPRRAAAIAAAVAVAATSIFAIGALAVSAGGRARAPVGPAPTLAGAADPAPAVAVHPAPTVATRPPARDRALADWLEAANPFVRWHGAAWLAHQVTRRELRRFLDSLPAGEALRHQPLAGWDDRDPLRPVSWITFERAAAFCAALDAQLPTSEAWVEASEGAWGLDPTGGGHLGPLREWTSTVRDGLVVVRGGHERMSPADRAAAASEPLMKSSEAAAGDRPAPNVVAAETIGFRCVR